MSMSGNVTPVVHAFKAENPQNQTLTKAQAEVHKKNLVINALVYSAVTLLGVALAIMICTITPSLSPAVKGLIFLACTAGIAAPAALISFEAWKALYTMNPQTTHLNIIGKYAFDIYPVPQ